MPRIPGFIQCVLLSQENGGEKKKDSFNFLLGLGLISSIDLEHNGSQEKAQGNLNGP